MNILLKKYNEIHHCPKVELRGKWNIAIVDKYNREYFPFGEEMKDNLILDQGLDLLTSGKYYGPYSIFNWNTIPSFLIGGAVYGDGSITPQTNDTELTNETNETSTVKQNSCSTTDDLISGMRTFRKVYDFPVIQVGDTNIIVREIGVYSNWGNPKTIFSKFLLPTSIKLDYGQWVRLFYDFTIGSDSITDPININLSSGNFDGSGELKLCGRWDDIFGQFDSNGNPTIIYGDSPRASFMPFCDIFCTEQEECYTKCFGSSYLLAPGILGFNDVNAKITSEWIGERLEQSLGTINPSNYLNGSAFRDIEYVFDYNNPIHDENVEGILFSVLRGSSSGSRQNTVDGWIWKFNANQIKKANKKIVILLKQSINRI